MDAKWFIEDIETTLPLVLGGTEVCINLTFLANGQDFRRAAPGQSSEYRQER